MLQRVPDNIQVWSVARHDHTPKHRFGRAGPRAEDKPASHVGQDEATVWGLLDILLISTAENFKSFHY